MYSFRLLPLAGVATLLLAGPAFAQDVEWTGPIHENSQQLTPNVFFDVLTNSHRVNAFGGTLGVACGTTSPGAIKDTPVSIGLSGGGQFVYARIRHHRFSVGFAWDGGRFKIGGHFTSASRATGTIRYRRGTPDRRSGYCDSGLVRWTAAPR
jgi:hypothetical protein